MYKHVPNHQPVIIWTNLNRELSVSQHCSIFPAYNGFSRQTKNRGSGFNMFQSPRSFWFGGFGPRKWEHCHVRHWQVTLCPCQVTSQAMQIICCHMVEKPAICAVFLQKLITKTQTYTRGAKMLTSNILQNMWGDVRKRLQEIPKTHRWSPIISSGNPTWHWKLRMSVGTIIRTWIFGDNLSPKNYEWISWCEQCSKSGW